MIPHLFSPQAIEGSLWFCQVTPDHFAQSDSSCCCCHFLDKSCWTVLRVSTAPVRTPKVTLVDGGAAKTCWMTMGGQKMARLCLTKLTGLSLAPPSHPAVGHHWMMDNFPPFLLRTKQHGAVHLVSPFLSTKRKLGNSTKMSLFWDYAFAICEHCPRDCEVPAPSCFDSLPSHDHCRTKLNVFQFPSSVNRQRILFA